MNPRYQYGVWLGMRNNSAECFIGNADGVFRAKEIRRLEPQDRRMTDGKWTVDRPEVRVVPSQSLRCHLREHESRGRESPRKTSMSSEPRSDAKAAMPSKKTKERRLTQIAADCESKNASGTLHMERKDWIEGMK